MASKLKSVPVTDTAKSEETAKMDARKHLEAYSAADKTVQAAKAQLAEANAKRSEAAKALFAIVGNKSFSYQGKTMKIASRTSRDEEGNPTGETSYFFKTISGETFTF